ncbi:MAG: M3 family peptidase, partial [Crocinitomicaceae bacterium]
MENPLLAAFDTKFELPPFKKIESDHYVIAIEKALNEAKDEIAKIIKNSEKPTFTNTIEALEKSGEKLQRNSSILFNLNSAETSDELQKIAQEISPKL